MMTDERLKVDDREPAEAIAEMVEHVLHLAKTWTTWDGSPRPMDDRAMTPHKAIRRVADHMIDHLAQLEAHLAGVPSLPDHWHGSAITTPADMARFGRDDLEEARSRLERLAQLWRLALRKVLPGELDRAEGEAYTPRDMAFCAVESAYYADAVGDLSAPGSPRAFGRSQA
jgi:hypothetical protein